MKQHIPILVDEILSFVPVHTRILIDGTFWHAGHTLAFVKHHPTLSSETLSLYAYDTDKETMNYGQQRINQEFPTLNSSIHITYVHDSYAHITHYISSATVDFVLLDLGINWAHVTSDHRWFSFQGDGPFDMRFDQSKWSTAYELIKDSNFDTIKSRFLLYGDFSEKKATAIATLISDQRNEKSLQTTASFVNLLQTIGIRKAELAPLFQSIRIATNNEFWHIDEFFSHIDNILAPWGRCAIISFHSIEDRLIKNHYKSLASTDWYTILTKHVITPHRQEIKRNKASRSAKLRIIEKNL